MQDQKLVTITLVLMIFFFLIGEIPASLVSRSSVVSLLFWGDETKADNSKVLEFCRQIATLMNGVYLAVNFFIYYMFCTNFRACFCEIVACAACWRGRKDKKAIVCEKEQQLAQVNIFIVDEECKQSFWVPLADFNWRLIKLFEDNKLAASIIHTAKI